MNCRLVSIFLGLLLVIIGCSNDKQVKRAITNDTMNRLVNNEKTSRNLRANKVLVNKAKEVLNKVEFTALPFKSQFNEQNNSQEINKLLSSKGKSTVLDSLFRSSDLGSSWFKGKNVQAKPNEFGQFLARLESHYRNYEILLYLLKDRYHHYNEYAPVYVLVLDKENFNLVSSSHIGIVYLEDVPNIIKNRGYSSAMFSIDSLLNITTEIKENVTNSYSPNYRKKQKILSEGQIDDEATVIYNYDNETGLMTLYDIEDSITISLYDKEVDDKDFFFHHLDLDGFRFDIKSFSDQFNKKLELKNHDGGKWLDVFKYEKALNNSSCAVRKEVCYDAHFIYYIFNIINGDTIASRLLEVKYQHLPNGQLELKKRISISHSGLSNCSWEVITLIHESPSNYSSSDNKRILLTNSSPWLYEYYFSTDTELPYEVEYEESKTTFDKAKQEEIDVLLNEK